MNATSKKHSVPPFWLAAGAQSLRRFFIKLAHTVVPPQAVMMDHAMRFFVSKTIWAAAELNVAEHLRIGPRTVEELALLTNTTPPALRRLMRLLSEQGIFKQVRPGVFAMTRCAKTLCDGPGSLRSTIRFLGSPTCWNSFGDILESITTEHTGEKPDSAGFFNALQKDPARLAIFNDAMTNLSAMAADAVNGAYNFSGQKTIVDIGGGEGMLLSAILEKYPESNGILFDLPHVIDRAQSFLSTRSASTRIHLKKGDFFNTIPADGDTYLLKNVLHDWDDEKCNAILKNIHQAMRARNTLLIIEALITDKNKFSTGTFFDIQLLVSLSGGRERTKEEFTRLLDTAGFCLQRVIPTFSPLSVMVCQKR
jgi:hypothetical protein